MTKNIEMGNIKAIGGGELVAEVYVDGSFFGEIHGVNGTQEGEEAYFPSLDEYIQKHQSEIDAFVGGGIVKTCPHCGEVYFSCDEKYWDEWPNSSDMAAGQAWDEHWENHCSENAILQLQIARAKRKEGAAALENHPQGWQALVHILIKRNGMRWYEAQNKVRLGTKLDVPEVRVRRGGGSDRRR
jgi:hypothetical protein